MSQSINVEMMALWEGPAAIDVGRPELLSCPYGNLATRGVKAGDYLSMEAPDGSVWLAHILQVLANDLLQFDTQGDLEVPVGEYAARITRPVADPCRTCQREQVVRTADHWHCVACHAIIPQGGRHANCPACIERIREQMFEGHAITAEVPLFGGKRMAKLHARTVAEFDHIADYVDQAVLNKGQPFDEEWTKGKMAEAGLAACLDDDGSGKRPLDLVTTEMSKGEAIAVAIKHFKPMSTPYYDALVNALQRFDGLVSDACFFDEKLEPTEAELIALSDNIALGPWPVEREFAIWGGRETIVLAVPSREETDQAEIAANNFIEAHKGRILEGRKVSIRGLFRLANHFRGDGFVRFGEGSELEERLQYLTTVVLQRNIAYMNVAILFQTLWIKPASEAKTLGKY